MMFIKKYFIGIVLLLTLLYACTQTIEQLQAQEIEKKVEIKTEVKKPTTTEIKNPSLIIVSPKDNELIKDSKVIVELKAENFNIAPVGSPVKNNEGHFHVWFDSEKKLGPQTSFTFENIVSGKHVIVAELVKSDHSSLNPKVTKTITVNVESDFVPKVEENLQANIREYTVEADDNGFYPSTIKAKIGQHVKINFKFRDDSIYFAGLDVKGPFPDITYKLKGEQPITANFTMLDRTKIISYWPSSGVKKAELIVEIEK